MSSNDHSIREQDSLISEEEFVALMELKYQNSNAHVNDIERRKVWNRLKPGLQQENTEVQEIRPDTSFKTPRWSVFSQTMAVMLVLVGILPSLFFISSSVDEHSNQNMNRRSIDSLQSIGTAKGITPLFSYVALNAVTIDTKGQLQVLTVQTPGYVQDILPGSNLAKSGDIVLFKATVKQSVYIALAMAKNNEAPELKYQQDLMPPGIGQLLQNGDNAYGYRLEPQDKQIRFCAIAAENQNVLKQRIRLLQQEWSKLPDESCVVIHQ